MYNSTNLLQVRLSCINFLNWHKKSLMLLCITTFTSLHEILKTIPYFPYHYVLYIHAKLNSNGKNENGTPGLTLQNSNDMHLHVHVHTHTDVHTSSYTQMSTHTHKHTTHRQTDVHTHIYTQTARCPSVSAKYERLFFF